MGSARDRILMAAIELFSGKGYQSTTVREICARAGVNVALVNYHFKGKLGLGEEVVDYLFEPVAETGLEDPSRMFSKREEWRSAMREFIRGFISVVEGGRTRQIARSSLIFRELDAPSELFPIMFEKYMSPIQKRLKHLVRMALPVDAAEDEVEMWFVTIISQCVMFRKSPPVATGMKGFDMSDPEVVDTISAHIAETVFARLDYNGGGQ